MRTRPSNKCTTSIPTCYSGPGGNIGNDPNTSDTESDSETVIEPPTDLVFENGSEQCSGPPPPLQTESSHDSNKY